MKRPAFLRLVLAVVASLTMSSAISQGYPNRPVRMVIPFRRGHSRRAGPGARAEGRRPNGPTVRRREPAGR